MMMTSQEIEAFVDELDAELALGKITYSNVDGRLHFVLPTTARDVISTGQGIIVHSFEWATDWSAWGRLTRTEKVDAVGEWLEAGREWEACASIYPIDEYLGFADTVGENIRRIEGLPRYTGCWLEGEDGVSHLA